MDLPMQRKPKQSGNNYVNDLLEDSQYIIKVIRIVFFRFFPLWMDCSLSFLVSFHGFIQMAWTPSTKAENYFYSNPLDADCCPGSRKLEAELIRMCISLYNGSCETVVGTTTPGGSESIAMGILVHREWARQTKGITKPNLVMTQTGHAAFIKACKIYNIEVIIVKVDPKSQRADPKEVEKHVNKNTIMVKRIYEDSLG